MARAGLNREAVIDAARSIVERDGLAALSMAAVAECVGVRAPSLYKHVRDLGQLRQGLAVMAKRDLLHHLREAVAGRAGEAGVRAAAEAYRNWALRHSGIYPLTLAVPEVGELDDERVSGELLATIGHTLRSWPVGDDASVHVIRRFRAVLHGFVSLEILGGFALPIDLDDSFRYAIDMYLESLPGRDEAPANSPSKSPDS